MLPYAQELSNTPAQIWMKVLGIIAHAHLTISIDCTELDDPKTLLVDP